LRLKLDHLGQKPSAGQAGSSVAGLRGSDKHQDPAKALYWKGRRRRNVSIDEVVLFRKALDQADAGRPPTP